MSFVLKRVETAEVVYINVLSPEADTVMRDECKIIIVMMYFNHKVLQVLFYVHFIFKYMNFILKTDSLLIFCIVNYILLSKTRKNH